MICTETEFCLGSHRVKEERSLHQTQRDGFPREGITELHSGQHWELPLCIYSWAFWTQEIVYMKVQGWEMPWNHQKVGCSSLFPISRRKKWCLRWAQKACKFLYFSSLKPLKPRESIRKTSSLCIISLKWFTIINTFTCVEYNINGKSLFWPPPTEWGGWRQNLVMIWWKSELSQSLMEGGRRETQRAT